MKKLIALFLAAVMLLSMAACGNVEKSPDAAIAPEGDTAPTEALAATSETESAVLPVNTEPLTPDQVFDEQFWLEKCSENEVVTLSITDPVHCETVLHSLGFFEFHTGVRASKTDKNIPLYPKELTIAGDSFKLVFDYNLPSVTSDNYYYMQNYILYGTKSTNAQQIVCVPADNLIGEWIFDWNGEEVAQGDYFCHLIYYSADTNVEGAGWVTNTIRYYEDSHNLYNIVKAVPSQEPDKDDTPRILVEQRNLYESHLETTKKTETVKINGKDVEVGEFTIVWNGMEKTFKYHAGMTLEEWASSNLNTSGWTIGDDNCLHYQEYIIRNSHYDVRWLFTHDTTIEAERS